MTENDNKEEKKVYSTPELVSYGDIRTITQTNDNIGVADGPAGGSMDKT